MKVRLYIKLFTTLVPVLVAAFIMHSCKKDIVPILKTSSVSEITGTDATCGGMITDEGSETISERGVCWSKSIFPTVADSKTSDGTGIGVFVSIISGLDIATIYYVRAYAKNGAGVGYGPVISFMTMGKAPSAQTLAAANITENSAKLRAVVNPNYLNTTVVFEYGTTSGYGLTSAATPGNLNNSSYTEVKADIYGLSGGRTYHYRVRTVNSIGTSYSEDMSFTTLGKLPTAKTYPASSLTATGVTLNGTVNANYLPATVTFEYGTTTAYGNTVTALPAIVTGNNPVSVSASLTGIIIGTTYHFRIIAINELGTAYGDDISISTSAQAPTIITHQARHLTGSGTVLHATVNPNWLSTTVMFEYGITTGYGNTIILDQNPLNGGSDTPVSSIITDLLQETTYHYRVTATNSSGTANGDDLIFTTLSENQISDIDGNIYTTVQIGSQVWMAENLSATKYCDGSDIPCIIENTKWSRLITGAFCWYKNDEVKYKELYGAYYNFYAVNTGNLCPVGWHVPTDTEWTTLTTFLGGNNSGGKLKETGTIFTSPPGLWEHPNTGATNETGFSARPGGLRFNTGSFYYDGYYGYWWSSREASQSSAWYRGMASMHGDVGRSWGDNRNQGFSVRCLKNNQ